MRRLALLFLLAIPLPLRAEEITVFAASSMIDALTEITAEWEAETGNRAVLSFAATSTLALQIARGAPADVFVAADPDWLAELGDRVSEGADIAGNRLVLIRTGPGAANLRVATAESFETLGRGPLAVALTDTVPAGRAARAALETLGLWGALPIAEAANVRAALALVAAGAAPLGIVYASDAAASDAVHVVAIFAANSHPPIRYRAALLTGGAGDTRAARDYLGALTDTAAATVFRRHGFTPP